ncbi:SRPBCC family protein [Ancylobacter sp. MQZ15Z-1]|uniref:SRPBCC family protein n=1 Tax=Ancylobacter mangrovi TaxID=2972472 RepID=A0A9X2T4V7_9HYPH|nr:SRPBCC family protein [Ancylobacter mangrovi]MCS0496566.1 SRPBCC family protein [Ancylobacter mangrovi]
MDLQNIFEVPLPPDRAWAVLMDIERIAPCMPGAELLETVDPQTYKGKVSVRLGPVALSFTGTARFVEIVEAEHRARVEAQGTDSKGRGGANASVVFSLAPSEIGTRVTVDTSLNLSGAVAQYGRGAGMIQSVAGQLIGQFAKNLANEIAAAPPPAAEPALAEVPSAASTAAEAPAAPRPRPAPAKPISGFSLIFSAFWSWLRGLFGLKST